MSEPENQDNIIVFAVNPHFPVLCNYNILEL